MLVTILTATYNAEATISATIESVLNQSYSDIEYIVIDGLSTDNTLNIVSKYQAAFTQKYGRAIKIYSQKDTNMYDALNFGASQAEGFLIGQINADDSYMPTAVETMVKLYNLEKYDAAWGSISIKLQNGKEIIKHAKIGRLWTTSGWCHPACFSKKEVILAHPYILNNMYADFDYITGLHVEGKKLVTTDQIISVFSFGSGGMSSKKGLKEVMFRVNSTYAVYKKYGMSKFYYLYRIAYEIIKNIFC